jgi:hypothetical protein
VVSSSCIDKMLRVQDLLAARRLLLDQCATSVQNVLCFCQECYAC